MTTGPDRIAANLQRVRDGIAAACARARRDVREVALVAVTKSAEPADIQRLVELGQVELAESRVQQLAQRAQDLRAWLATRPDLAGAVHWHMVGHLQRNKVKPCLEAADVIHSVDSLRLAEEISLRAQVQERAIPCLVEVNCSQEPQKEGVAVGAGLHLGEQISTLPGIRLVGLMTMAPLSDDPEHARPTFARLRELFEEMRHDKIGGRDFRHLSMGMSGDYQVAIEEGATLVRVGSALFA